MQHFAWLALGTCVDTCHFFPWCLYIPTHLRENQHRNMYHPAAQSDWHASGYCDKNDTTGNGLITIAMILMKSHMRWYFKLNIAVGLDPSIPGELSNSMRIQLNAKRCKHKPAHWTLVLTYVMLPQCYQVWNFYRWGMYAHGGIVFPVAVIVVSDARL